MMAVGILMTHRIAGPVCRFEQYFCALARGEGSGPRRIRSCNELQEVCGIDQRWP